MQVGIDITELTRIISALSNGEMVFINKILTRKERSRVNPIKENYERISGYWAAKEAAVKALGTGFRFGISFQDIEINYHEDGSPFYHFSGEYLKLMKKKKLFSSSLSISHCRTHAVAVSVLF